jgi:hypothetical protein
LSLLIISFSIAVADETSQFYGWATSDALCGVHHRDGLKASPLGINLVGA